MRLLTLSTLVVSALGAAMPMPAELVERDTVYLFGYAYTAINYGGSEFTIGLSATQVGRFKQTACVTLNGYYSGWNDIFSSIKIQTGNTCTFYT
jgi:hypothetical protein